MRLRMTGVAAAALGAATATLLVACEQQTDISCTFEERCIGRNIERCDPATGVTEAQDCAAACGAALDLGCGWVDTLGGYRCRCAPPPTAAPTSTGDDDVTGGDDDDTTGSDGVGTDDDPSSVGDDADDGDGGPDRTCWRECRSGNRAMVCSDGYVEIREACAYGCEDGHCLAPPSPPEEPAPAAQCAPCSATAGCPAGSRCIHWHAVPDESFCALTCSTTADCPPNSTCSATSSGDVLCHPVWVTTCDEDLQVTIDACGTAIEIVACAAGCHNDACLPESPDDIGEEPPPLPEDDDEPDDTDDPTPTPEDPSEDPPPPPTCSDDCRGSDRVSACSDGSVRTIESCEHGCVAGSCQPCAAGAASCLSDNEMRHCVTHGDGRRSYEYESCPTGTTCAGGACATCELRCEAGGFSRWSTDAQLVCDTTGAVVEECSGNAVCADHLDACCAVHVHRTSHGVRVCTDGTAYGIAPGGTDRFYHGTISTSGCDITVASLWYVVDFPEQNRHVSFPSSYIHWTSATTFEVTGTPYDIGTATVGEEVEVHFEIRFADAAPTIWVGQAILTHVEHCN